MNADRARKVFKSHLLQSPFVILDATTRDDRKRIVELAESKSLAHNHDACQKARSELTNPRTRLGAEIGWLPGVSPKKAQELISLLFSSAMSARSQTGLPVLAHLNLLAAAFEAVDEGVAATDIAAFILEMALLVETLSVDEVLRDINEDRLISGFPAIKGTDQIENELLERKRFYRGVVKDALNQLPSSSIIEAMTIVADNSTHGGQQQAPELIDELVDSYAVETHEFLNQEAETAQKLITAIRSSAASGENVVRPLLDKLEAVARNWDKVAQPIQLCAKARGTQHEPSDEMAYSLRSLAVDLYNKHEMLSEARRLSKIMQELFSELPEVLERVEQDLEELSNISQRSGDSDEIAPIGKLCTTAINAIKHNPRSGYSEGLRVLKEGTELLSSLSIPANSPTRLEARNIISLTLLQCAITYGNETSSWKPCVSLLEEALTLASDDELRTKIRNNLSILKRSSANLYDIEPIKNAPSLRTINGVGFALYGSTQKDPSDNSYMATYYFVFLFFPIFPIARYRVIPTAEGFRFLGKGKLRAFDKWHLAIAIGLILFAFGKL